MKKLTLILAIAIIFTLCTGCSNKTIKLTPDNIEEYFIINYGHQTWSGSNEYRVKYTVETDKKKDFTPDSVEITFECVYTTFHRDKYFNGEFVTDTHEFTVMVPVSGTVSTSEQWRYGYILNFDSSDFEEQSFKIISVSGSVTLN